MQSKTDKEEYEIGLNQKIISILRRKPWQYCAEIYSRDPFTGITYGQMRYRLKKLVAAGVVKEHLPTLEIERSQYNVLEGF